MAARFLPKERKPSKERKPGSGSLSKPSGAPGRQNLAVTETEDAFAGIKIPLAIPLMTRNVGRFLRSEVACCLQRIDSDVHQGAAAGKILL